MDETHIRAATAADVSAIRQIVDQAYRPYIAHLGASVGEKSNTCVKKSTT